MGHGRTLIAAALAALISMFAVEIPAFAQTAVRETSIREGQRFDISPFSFAIEFASEVQLTQANLVDQDGSQTQLDVVNYRRRGSLFVIPLPVLIPHGYRLHWRARERGGGYTTGSVGFIVNGCDDPQAAR